jgi:hypothetical protein
MMMMMLMIWWTTDCGHIRQTSCSSVHVVFDMGLAARACSVGSHDTGDKRQAWSLLSTMEGL